MAENTGFVDPLDNIIRKTKEAYGIPDDVSTPTVNKTPPAVDIDIEDEEDDDIYGVHDFEKELEEEERQMKEEEEARKQAILAERRANEKPVEKMPPRSLDPDFQKEAVDFQADHVAVVTGMIEKVKAKYHLVGGIPQEKQRFIQGDLMEYYYQNGDEITPAFEKLILDNWEHVDPKTGEAYPQVENNTNENTTSNTSEEKKEEPPTININVEAGTRDVVVNVPNDVAVQMKRNNVINVHVREVTDEDMKSVTVIENPGIPGIIRPYESDVNDVPITLPLSGYKCVVRPVSWFESIDLAAPSSNSKVDFQIQRWSIIYNHIKNVSIGEFENFEDFLKKTKYADLPLLEWAILTGTADETEPLEITCGNRRCGKQHVYTYVPRSLVHLNEDRLPEKYWDVHNAAPGSEGAMKLFAEINTKRTRYMLPETKIIIEMNEPSAYDYIMKLLPTIIQKYAEKRPDDPNMDNFDEERLFQDPTLYNFSYKITCMMRISAICIRDEKDPNKEYRFTTWEDIEAQIDNIKIMKDSMLLVRLAMNSHNLASPVDLYLENVTCPYCGRVEKRIPLSNLTQTLLFRASRRLDDMEVNLIKLD
jgi:hypothetical protein